MIFSLLILFLLLENISKSPPCVIMSFVTLQSFLVTFLGLLEVFVINIFMTTQCMSVTEVNVKLNGFAEIFECSLMLFL